MVIGFKTRFVQPILNGTKIHTLREDPHNRWKPGRVMHMATGVRTKNYRQFHMDTCKGIQTVDICIPDEGLAWIYVDDKIILTSEAEEQFARNDGFEDLNEFTNWFRLAYPKQYTITRKLIHWTDFKY